MRLEYDLNKKQCVTPKIGYFGRKLETNRPVCPINLLQEVNRQPEAHIIGGTLDLRYELAKESATVFRIQKLRLWYLQGPYGVWFQ